MIEPRRLAMINSDGKAKPPLSDPRGVVTKTYDLRLRIMARTPYDHLFTELGTVDAAEAALHDGCDAIYIDTFGDYGLARIGASTAVPVVGAGAASIAAAARHLPTFSIVTVWPPSMTYLYDERLGGCPGGAQCRGVHFLSGEEELDRVGRPDGVKERMIRQEGGIVDRLTELSREAVAHDRSDGVLLGCTCMSPVAAELQGRCPFPVLDPSRLGLEAAFRAVLAQPPEVRAVTTRLSGLAGDVVTAYLGRPSADSTAAGTAAGECEACAVARAMGPPAG